MKPKSIIEMTKMEIINMAYRKYKYQKMYEILGENGINNAMAEANGDINKAISRYKNNLIMSRNDFQDCVINGDNNGFMKQYLSTEDYDFWERKHG